MLDTKQSWDELVARHAPDAATRDAILANPLYDNITGRFVQSHDYIAMERLYEIHASGRYDLIVVDTPPTRNAIDFLEAPERMADFFSSRLLRWLTVPARSRVFTMASKPFYTVADRILGSQFLQDIAEFFLLFQTMYDGFVERAQAVTRTLSDKRTTFVVVSTLEAVAGPGGGVLHRGAGRPATSRSARWCSTRCCRSWFLDREPRAAERLCRDDRRPAAEDAGRRRPGRPTPPQLARVLGEVGESFLNFQVVATREAEQRGELAAHADVVATVPYADHDITDLAGLLELGERCGAERSALAAGRASRDSRPMATLAELARFFTRLDTPSVAHLQRLAASWGLLADFCFADLLLFGVVGEPRDERRQPLRRAGPGAAHHGPDRLPGRLGRHRARGGGPPAGRPGLPAGRDHRGRDARSRR